MSKLSKQKRQNQNKSNHILDEIDYPDQKLKCKKLNHKDCQAICGFGTFVLTEGRRSDNRCIKIWNEFAEFKYSQDVKSKIITLIPWGKTLVVGTTRNLQLWEIDMDQKIKITFSKNITNHTIIEAVIWKDLLLTRHEDAHFKSIYSLWNKRAEYVPYSDQFVQEHICFVHKDVLWALNVDGLSLWTLTTGKRHKIENVKTIAVGRHNYKCRLWNQNAIALVCQEGIKILSLEGDLIRILNVKDVLKITEWNRKLVCVTQDAIEIWNSDGTLWRKVERASDWRNTGLLSHRGKLWCGTDRQRAIQVLYHTNEWKLQRLLWIGRLKNSPRECFIASLPREIVTLVISFL